MSEELIRKNLTKHGKKIGLYEYYSIGNTTLKDLKKFEIIPNKNYGRYENRKPDALLIDRRDKTDIKIILVQEDKDPKEFVTPQDKEKAVKQCVELYCKPLNAKIEVVTDYNEWVWVNPQVKNKNGYEYILTEDGYPIQTPLEFKTAQQINENLKLITKILESINEKNSILKKEETQNPSNLADRVWQTIWLASGEDPDKCLATFVEIFVFKYLSDLEILNINDDGVKVTFEEVMKKDSNSLKYYFKCVRPHIKKMFPEDKKDGTSIINGTVLKPDIEEHNIIFHTILNEFYKFGTLSNIDPQFKSRLYEKFLKKSLSQKNWGQYFTPRNIIKAMIQISGIEKLPEGSKVYDPACGVGGFILEPLLANRQDDYCIDSDGNLQKRLTYLGHDRDPNTIILAKANMLIFISELLRENKAITKQFSKMFNNTFKSLHKSVLGSLSDIHNDYYDLIMTNPPYVTSGSSTQKDVIKQDGRLSSFYKINAIGIEGLFVEKIIRELKPNANALIIIPDGILNRLNDNKLRKFIKDNCIINAIISLPINAFYTSIKKTYILSVTKKKETRKKEFIPQKDPVFTYLVINVGETLDAKRFECENDLPKMVKQYNYFMVDKNNFENEDPQLKIQPIDKFDPNNYWSVDRWWTTDEKIKLGMKEEKELLTIDEFYEKMKGFKGTIDDAVKKLGNMKNEIVETSKTQNLSLKEIFDLTIKTNSSKFTKKFIYKNKGPIPVYSASKHEYFVNYGYVKDNLSNVKYFENCLTWNIDGSVGKAFFRKARFTLSEKVIPLILKDNYKENIDYEYVKYLLEEKALEFGFQFSNKAGKSKIKDIEIPFPVTKKRKLDLGKQREIAQRYKELETIKSKLIDRLNGIIDTSSNINLA